MPDELLNEVVDGVALLTLNRPAKRNALTPTLIEAIAAALREHDERDDVAAIVLTGADPAFCAGLDLGALAEGQLGGNRGCPVPGDLQTPVIGAINGVAVTGGLEIALACDFTIASERALFADTHARVGIMPGWGLSVCLPQAIGLRRAKQMSFTGNYIDADTAALWGLVNQIVPHDEIVDTALALGRDIRSIDAQAVHGMKELYRRTAAAAPGDAMAVERDYSSNWLQAGSFDRDALAANRTAIQSRGSGQV